MEPLKFTDLFKHFLETAVRTYTEVEAAAILFLVDSKIDMPRLRKWIKPDVTIIISSHNSEWLEGVAEVGMHPLLLSIPNNVHIYDRITHSILESVADDFIPYGCRIVALYSGFDPMIYDSISVINLREHLDRLSGRDLRQLESRVPLATLKLVVDLALEIGREGREGKVVGSLFVVGDTRKVLQQSKPAGFDPMRGYHRRERNLRDPRVREGIKEIAQLDGAFVVSSDGTAEAACRYLDTSTATITLSKGLGARHWAAAAVSRTTHALAIVVSQSSGTVRIFQNGEVVLRIESRHQQPMVWRDFDSETSEM